MNYQHVNEMPLINEVSIVREAQPVAEDNFMLKSGSIAPQVQSYSGTGISLVNNNDEQLGNLLVTNTLTDLRIQFTVNEYYSIAEVQLWIGIDPEKVPMNKNQIPIPGKFTYKAKGQSDYVFTTKLTDILQGYGLLFDGTQPIYIFAQAKIKNKITNEEQLTWSEGESHGTSKWGTYFMYYCSLPAGVGCVPHFGLCGTKMEDGIFYYDNTNEGGEQNIYADTESGPVVGKLKYDDGKIYFLVDVGNWSITDLIKPTVKYQLFNEPGSPATNLISVNDLEYASEGWWSIDVPKANYYLIQLNIQNCTTR